MTVHLPYPTVVADPEKSSQGPGWLHDIIWGAQLPQVIAAQPPQKNWATMDIQGLADKLGRATRANMMVSPTGVVGYYNTGLVKIAMRDGRVWGRAAVSRLLPQEEIELPHVQIDGNLGGYADFYRDTTPPGYFLAPSERVYLRTCDAILPQVSDTIATGIPQDNATLEGVSLYLSQAGTVTNLHWDLRSGAIQQLRGRKRVILFAPSEISKLPMYPTDHVFARRSLINGRIDAAAVTDHPALAQARAFICDIGPGDWLYLPAGWMHYVETCNDNCISLIINFRR